MPKIDLSSFQRAVLGSLVMGDALFNRNPSKLLDRVILADKKIIAAKRTTSDIDRVHFVSKAYELIVAGSETDEHMDNCPPDSAGYGEYLLLIHRIATDPKLDDALKAVYGDGALPSLKERQWLYLETGRKFSSDIIKRLIGENHDQIPDFKILKLIVESDNNVVEEQIPHFIKEDGTMRTQEEYESTYGQYGL